MIQGGIMRSRKGERALTVFLAAALAAALGVCARALLQRNGAQARLKEVYQGAVLSAIRQMEDIELNLTKALVSSDQAAADRYVSRAAAGAGQVGRSLSLLPLAHPAGKNAVKFVNQAADYLSGLVGSPIELEDMNRIGSLTDACRSYTLALMDAREDLPGQAEAAKTFYDAAGDGGGYDSQVSYPTLIYDGPFSDARDFGAPKALGGRTVSKEEAMALARQIIGEERVKRVSPGADMGGSIPCWGVTVETEDVTMQAAVTQTGGKLLWLAPEKADFAPEKSLEECRESALLFLHRNGYENMEATYFQVYQGVAVISFAAAQGDTLLYPDLIKVQLRMDTAQVVGVEARNYLTNHTFRGALAPALSLEEAEGRVSERLKLTSGRLCLIPTDGGEKLCYEFRGDFLGHTYLCYINALDGRQEQLLKVIEDGSGIETA